MFVSVAGAAWTISPDWTISSDWTTTEDATTYTLTMQTPTGTGTVSPTVGTHEYADETNVSLVATSGSGYGFAAWQIDGVNVSTSATYYVVMGANHTVKAFFAENVYSLGITITNPQNIYYVDTSVPVALATTGNDTGVSVVWNVQFLNLTWLYATNQTYSGATSFTISESLTATFYAWATGDHATATAQTAFGVTSTSVYVLAISITSPTNTTYSLRTVPVAVTTLSSGNETGVVYNWNVLIDGATWLYLTNQTIAETTIVFTDNCSAVFACSAMGTHGATDYETVSFTVSIPSSDNILPSVSVTPFWQFLYAGDMIGFFSGLLAVSFSSLDVALGMISLVFMVPLYLKTKSLLLLCIVWILLGSFLVVAMPVISPLAILFVSLGIAGLIYKLFRPSHSY